jgi:hypothetical protein
VGQSRRANDNSQGWYKKKPENKVLATAAPHVSCTESTECGVAWRWQQFYLPGIYRIIGQGLFLIHYSISSEAQLTGDPENCHGTSQ